MNPLPDGTYDAFVLDVSDRSSVESDRPALVPKGVVVSTGDGGAKRITGSEKYFPTFGLRASISRGFKVHGVLAGGVVVVVGPGQGAGF